MCDLQGGNLVSWETEAEYDAMKNYLSENECQYLQNTKVIQIKYEFKHENKITLQLQALY